MISRILSLRGLIPVLIICFFCFSCTEDQAPDTEGDDSGATEGWTTIKKVISAENGGSLATVDNKFQLIVPAGALSEDTEISVGVSEDDLEFEFGPDGLQFNTPVTALLSLSTEDLNQHEVSEENMLDLTEEIIAGVSALIGSDGAVEYLDGDQTTDMSNGTLQLNLSIEHFSKLIYGKDLIIKPIFDETGYFVNEPFSISFKGRSYEFDGNGQLIYSAPNTIVGVLKGEADGFNTENTVIQRSMENWTDLENVTNYRCFDTPDFYDFPVKFRAEFAGLFGDDDSDQQTPGIHDNIFGSSVKIECKENPDSIEISEGVSAVCGSGECASEVGTDGSYSCGEGCVMYFPNAWLTCDGTCGTSGGGSLICTEGTIVYDDSTALDCGNQDCQFSEDGTLECAETYPVFTYKDIIIRPIYREEGYYVNLPFRIYFQGRLKKLPTLSDTIVNVLKGEGNLEEWNDEDTLLEEGADNWTDLVNSTRYACHDTPGTYDFDVRFKSNYMEYLHDWFGGEVEIICKPNPDSVIDSLEVSPGVFALCAGGECGDEVESDGSYSCGAGCMLVFLNAELTCDGTCGISGGVNMDCTEGTIAFDDSTTANCDDHKCQYSADGTLECEQTYSVGGTVSGLNGTLVLDNESDNGWSENITLTTNGTFNFEFYLASGQPYSVTIVSQPADQNCVVSSGSGTIGLADVTSIQVVCEAMAQDFSIGGTVTGLDGTLVLENQGETVSIDTNGSFTFPVTWPNASTYDVQVSTPPEGQSCSVSNGSGTISEADVTNVQVACQNSADYYVAVSDWNDSSLGIIYHYNANNVDNGNGGWTQVWSQSNSSIGDIAAAGDSSIVATSSQAVFHFNGTSWQQLSAPEYIANISFGIVEYSATLSRFIVLGYGQVSSVWTGGLWYSDNGLDWSGFIQTGSPIRAAACGTEGCWHIGSYNYNGYRSADGINWVRPWDDDKATNLGSANAIAFGNGMWITVDAADDIQKSTDFGDTWADQTTGDGSALELNVIAFGNGMFVTACFDEFDTYETTVYRSTDGESWSKVTLPNDYMELIPKSITYSAWEGKFMIVGTYGNAFQSADGINWTNVGPQVFELEFVGVTAVR